MPNISRIALALIAVIGALTVSLVYHQLWTQDYHSDPDGDVLVVVNGRSEVLHTEMPSCGDLAKDLKDQNDLFSRQALEGAELATKELRDSARDLAPPCKALNLGVSLTPDEGQLDQVAHALANAIARAPTLGVISASTSLLSLPLINVCTRLRIPLLLVTATNDGLIDPETKGLIFRLPAKNSNQVDSIANELKKEIHTKIAVLYETNSYGDSLYGGLAERLGRQTKPYYSFSISNYTDVSIAVSLFGSLGVDTCVFLGYLDKASDLLRKLEAVVPKDKNLAIILSDGSYPAKAGVNATQLQTSLVFPIEMKNAERKKHGLGWFAYDAVYMFFALKNRLRQTDFWRSQAALSEPFDKGWQDNNSPLPKYSFDENGENSCAKQVNHIRSDTGTSSPSEGSQVVTDCYFLVDTKDF